MRLVRHFDRGYGHATKTEEGYWEVYFFDDYSTPVIFHSTAPSNKILYFVEDTDYE